MGDDPARRRGVGAADGHPRRACSLEWQARSLAAIVIATYLVDLLSPALRFPDWFHQLALSAHLGQPMVGSWDWPGMVVCVALAIGGLLVGGWGMSRRDVRG